MTGLEATFYIRPISSSVFILYRVKFGNFWLFEIILWEIFLREIAKLCETVPTDGKLTALQVVPVHHCDIRTSPATPPTGAPWYAIQSTVTLACDFRSL